MCAVATVQSGHPFSPFLDTAFNYEELFGDVDGATLRDQFRHCCVRDHVSSLVRGLNM
jgi:hypothetical protein